MKVNLITLILVSLLAFQAKAQQSRYDFKDFNKIIVGPHVELILTEASEESVDIEIDKPIERLVKVKKRGKTLKIFLDNARLYNKYDSRSKYNWKKRTKYNYYGDVRVVARVSYKQLKAIQIRGSELAKIDGNLQGDKFKAKLYGSCDLNIDEVDVSKFKMKLYGDNEVRINSGNAEKQLVRVYGSNYVNTKKLQSDVVKSTSFGSNELLLYSNTKLKYNVFGELVIDDFGDGHHRRGIVLGLADVY
ncbi:MAG: DUF2807 domain-containing protein [Bacteroidota bacterium]